MYNNLQYLPCFYPHSAVFVADYDSVTSVSSIPSNL